MSDSCMVCDSVDGIKRLSPGDIINRGIYWDVEHAYPTSLKGWIVIVLRRHAKALHELSSDEFEQLQRFISKATHILHAAYETEKEYILCLCEGDGFSHLHVHVVPIREDTPDTERGPKIIAHLNPDLEQVLSDEEIINICEELKRLFTVFN